LKLTFYLRIGVRLLRLRISCDADSWRYALILLSLSSDCY